MVRQQIDRFFRALAHQLNRPARVILTGASAGALWGSLRLSQDVDFAIQSVPHRRDAWQDIEAAVTRTVRLTGIPANYAEDIDRWSSISFLDYQRHTLPYRRYRRLEVRLIDPAYWTIGKIARLWPSDAEDLVVVLRRRRIALPRLLRLWATAIRASPRSPALTRCRQHVESFLRSAGNQVWGKDFDSTRAIGQFHKALFRETRQRVN